MLLSILNPIYHQGINEQDPCLNLHTNQAKKCTVTCKRLLGSTSDSIKNVSLLIDVERRGENDP